MLDRGVCETKSHCLALKLPCTTRLVAKPGVEELNPTAVSKHFHPKNYYFIELLRKQTFRQRRSGPNRNFSYAPLDKPSQIIIPTVGLIITIAMKLKNPNLKS